MSGARVIARFPSYRFHECGNVFSIRKGGFLKPLKVPNGYRHVVLCDGGTKQRVAVHRVIAEAFHGEGGEMMVNHINGVKADNRACNLEWVTASQNVKAAYEAGLRIIDDAHKARCAKLGHAWKGVKRNVSL